MDNLSGVAFHVKLPRPDCWQSPKLCWHRRLYGAEISCSPMCIILVNVFDSSICEKSRRNYKHFFLYSTDIGYLITPTGSNSNNGAKSIQRRYNSLWVLLIVEIRRSYDCLISTKVINILVKRHVYIESAPMVNLTSIRFQWGAHLVLRFWNV